MKRPTPTNPQDVKLVRMILEYWLHHPEAKETLTGIHCVWLKKWSDPNAVKQALGYLMQKDWVLVRLPPRTEEIYKLNPGNLQEMRRFLSEAEDGK